MKSQTLVLCASLASVLILLEQGLNVKSQQTPAIDLPVELVGFPVIIVAVKLSNFVKKLAYSLNPKTYTGRVRRSISVEENEEELIDLDEAERRLVSELGENVCIYTRVCLYHAGKAIKTKSTRDYQLDWGEIFSNYKTSAEKQKEFYLLSVFLGDIVASPKFCNGLAKRGRACKD
ncbi:uncharacterized protein LOC108740922 [Agrilus planipennis]|uniref:Uncharacterized protein LOC108740922 n=1 Tax=Agrilus planipennis TaxID=224129 RepID=A0A1W4XDW5_AGRPL|nr:uncharacterized protein LOC108740922 [Agrilus planipennis]